ncbi:PTS glucose transporter subunit IIA [Clostridium sp. YIM B02506]|uniref:PTS sugar transporter subunit IIA n=1 Tax=Clostridium sp. YIM B02506 TaxID=2910680 RepID=UPI001EEE3D7C|nr:PTS glucose transporter subunit IIA [Clostridium sp. YIM B02506]
MFKFFKKASLSEIIKAPISGKCIPLEEVKDEVFSSKMIGDGIAIDSIGDIVYAPADGTIATIVNSKHAVGMQLNNGVEILIHVGLETVELKGEGFTLLVNVDDKVKEGTPLIKIDRAFIESKGMSLVTPVIIIESEKYDIDKCAIGQEVYGGKSSVIEYRIK